MERKKAIFISCETKATGRECQEASEYIAVIHYAICILQKVLKRWFNR